jgi:hypothetical protein
MSGGSESAGSECARETHVRIDAQPVSSEFVPNVCLPQSLGSRAAQFKHIFLA